jgi:hypothetical protein
LVSCSIVLFSVQFPKKIFGFNNSIKSNSIFRPTLNVIRDDVINQLMWSNWSRLVSPKSPTVCI